MESVQTSLLTRDDTLLGICEALGEDFGFNPIWLRITLAVLLLASPTAVLAAYLGAGLVVVVTRWLVPNPRVAQAKEGPADAEPVGVHRAQGELALAA